MLLAGGAVHRTLCARRAALDPGQARTGPLVRRPTTRSRGWTPAGQFVLRYAPGENFNGSVHDIAGVCNESGNVFGLMPHPEHAVDASSAARPTA